MQRALGQQPPREYRENPKRHLGGGNAPPKKDVLPTSRNLDPTPVCSGDPPASGHDHRYAGYAELVSGPFPDENAEDDGAECDGVFETGTVVDGLGVLVYGEEGEGDEGERDFPPAFVDPGVECGAEA